MSLSKLKELAEKKTAVGKMKKNLFDQITAEKIRSKTTDEAIAKTFRLNRLDQIVEQTKPKAKRQGRPQIPRINREGGIDYAPDVDPYEDMDVEGLLNLQDYVAPQVEKQIAKIPKEKLQNMKWILVFGNLVIRLVILLLYMRKKILLQLRVQKELHQKKMMMK